MNTRSHPTLLYSVGTQVVAQKDVMSTHDRIAHPAGAVGVIVRTPVDRTHAYRVKFSDGFEAPIHHDQLVQLADFKSRELRRDTSVASSALSERVIYRCVIGSRAYGLEDDRSDTDRRGVYLPTADLHWSLYGVPEQLENETPEFEELRAIARDCVTRHHAHHYLGFAATQWRLFGNEPKPRVKPLLYTYRVLLTGIHLMRTGDIEANIVRLNESAKLSYIDELVARKQAGPEKGTLDAADVEFYQREYERLTKELESAYEASTLRESPTVRASLSDLLVRLRLSGRTVDVVAGRRLAN